MTRADKLVAAALAVVLFAAVLGLVAYPARAARDDLRGTRSLLSSQLEVARAQVHLQREQLDLQREQLAVSTQSRDAALRTDHRLAALVATSRQLRDLTARTVAAADQATATAEEINVLTQHLLALSVRLEHPTRQIERHVESLDRKTGGPVP